MTDRNPKQPPKIAPLPATIIRPQWTVTIPVYNCYAYIRETLESVLAQLPEHPSMQIEVIDDASTDGDVAALVAAVGQGRVGYFRQPQNVGSLRNFETCINRAHGHWIHLLHGDDNVLPGFYSEIRTLFQEYPEAGAAFTDFYYMNEKSQRLWCEKPLVDRPQLLKDWLRTIAKGQRIQPPAIVVKRSVYEHLGSFFAVPYGEDWEMWIRIAAHYRFAHSPKHLAQYRKHTQNITSHSLLSGQNIRDIQHVINIAQEYLPVNERKELKRIAEMQFSKYFGKISHTLYHTYNNPAAARVQAWGALRMHVNKVTLRNLLKIWIKSSIRYKRFS